MLPRNPFNISYAEMVDSGEAFLSLFYHSALEVEIPNGEPVLSEDMFEKVVFFSSSPGGGKSSMLHFFSPAVLNAIAQSKEQNIEAYRYLEGLGVIDGSAVRLLGVQISCARNYGAIEDIYEGGIAEQIFFALLNVRTLKESLKSILLLRKADVSDLRRITFADIPEEMSAEFPKSWTGKDFYEWACNEERNVCELINNMDSVSHLKFVHNYFSIPQLFDPSKILFDGKTFVDKALFMLDDVHKLTKKQRNILRESIITVRVQTGVWLAQRSYALAENEILGLDGSKGRDYISRKLEEPREGTTKAFIKTLEAIADRRVKASDLVDTSQFRSYIGESIDWLTDKKSFAKLEKAYSKLRQELKQYGTDSPDPECLSPDDMMDWSIKLQVKKILILRKTITRQVILSDEFLCPTDAEIQKGESDRGVVLAARYYFCIENGLPFYYGIDKLLSLSFYNVYQFLNFSGELFTRRLSYKYEKKRRQLNVIPPVEQEEIIKRLSDQRWKELDTMYSNAIEIKAFLENISYLAIRMRKRGTASYFGGTYTGIGIREQLFSDIIQREECKKLKSVLATCISGNLLNMRRIKQGSKGETAVVFYLNRWICAHFQLPLVYGSWKACNKDLLNALCHMPEQFQNLVRNEGGIYEP